MRCLSKPVNAHLGRSHTALAHFQIRVSASRSCKQDTRVVHLPLLIALQTFACVPCASHVSVGGHDGKDMRKRPLDDDMTEKGENDADVPTATVRALQHDAMPHNQAFFCF